MQKKIYNTVTVRRKSISLPVETVEWLEMKSKKTGLTQSKIIEMSLAEWRNNRNENL